MVCMFLLDTLGLDLYFIWSFLHLLSELGSTDEKIQVSWLMGLSKTQCVLCIYFILCVPLSRQLTLIVDIKLKEIRLLPFCVTKQRTFSSNDKWNQLDQTWLINLVICVLTFKNICSRNSSVPYPRILFLMTNRCR